MEQNRDIHFSVQRDGDEVLIRFDLATVLELLPSLCFVAGLTSGATEPPSVEEKDRARNLVTFFIRTVIRDGLCDFSPEEMRRGLGHEVPI